LSVLIVISLIFVDWRNQMTMVESTPVTTSAHAVEYEQVVSANVRMYLHMRGISQAELSVPLGLKPPAVSLKLNNKTTWSLPDLVNTADFLGVSIEDLLDDTLLRKMEHRYAQNNRKAADVSAASELPRLGLNQRHFD
jgi:transcriptional regulator with XRE-family HTH domain